MKLKHHTNFQSLSVESAKKIEEKPANSACLYTNWKLVLLTLFFGLLTITIMTVTASAADPTVSVSGSTVTVTGDVASDNALRNTLATNYSAIFQNEYNT